MTTNWLALRSLRRNQQLLKVINTLSMHLQLLVEGYVTDVQPATLDAARAELAEFLNKLEQGTRQANESEIGVIYGADPRFQAFVETYPDAQKYASVLALTDDFALVLRLLDSEELHDQEQLLAYLAELRMLVEEQINQDVTQAL